MSIPSNFERIMVVVGAIDCVIIPILFAANPHDLFPFPGLYLIEIALLGLAGLSTLNLAFWPRSNQGDVALGIAGILLAFVVLGAWTIGYFLLPGFLAFLVTGFLASHRNGLKITRQLGVLMLAGFAQAALILLVLTLHTQRGIV